MLQELSSNITKQNLGYSFSSFKDNFKFGKLNHVAIVVPDLQKSAKLHKEVFGAECSGEIEIPEHGVKTVFAKYENTKVELLHPLGEKSPIDKFLKQNPLGKVHHLCYEVEDLAEAIVHVKRMGVRTLGKKPKIGAHGKPVMFLHPKDCDGVLIEMEQK
ncbi:methylmalonyl-coa epimerase [Anaeramoeba flamelloides]|uniref:Methylmalonyl-CoA epimerase, mitochondrial n=1 Tax=Anaeramoeba flamelloides TaxID=1746091 RepID=A0AAV7Z532_9EUKA|nr:methylmalonyl-coa epimerase [Anaeramoeba flamelloides]KAJ6251510.1 methylmalonyl-coa epimerase [Anaeramoeba flamelloides]